MKMPTVLMESLETRLNTIQAHLEALQTDLELIPPLQELPQLNGLVARLKTASYQASGEVRKLKLSLHAELNSRRIGG